MDLMQSSIRRSLANELYHADKGPASKQLDVSVPKRHKMVHQEGTPKLGQSQTKNALGMFLALRGIQTAPLDSNPKIPTNSKPQNNSSRDPRRLSVIQQPEQPGENSRQNISIKFPPLPSEFPQRFAIISSFMLQKRRSFCRQIELLCPGCEFIERDFSAVPSTLRDDKNTINFDSSEEADLVISPSTGVLLSTIQKIQQRSLPGQGIQQNTFHLRLSQVSIKYERVVVLVSQGIVEQSNVAPNASTTNTIHNGLGRREPAPTVEDTGETASEIGLGDTQALASLISFAAGLETDVHVQLILGGEKNLAAWTSYHIYASGTSQRMLTDESIWEQVLRRAGLNAFAASIILTHLQQPMVDEPPGTTLSGGMTTEDFGLTAFLKMDLKSRVTHFEKILGGQRVMRRVNACLERRWISESTGFRGVGSKLK
jgi:hypothetical protein